MDSVDITVIGAGVVGLSVAARLADGNRSIVVLERHEAIGMEASSRNSEVIHAGIYYPPGSLKNRMCLRGNELMYVLCKKHSIGHVNCGKLIVAVTPEQEAQLPALDELASGNGARDLRIIGGDEIRRLEPKVSARAALHCPTSGIVDSHSLMRHFRNRATDGGAGFAFNAPVKALDKIDGGWEVRVGDSSGEDYRFRSTLVINCAGMGSGEVAEMAGIDIDEAHYRIHYRKGVYFRVTHRLGEMPSMLIYPVPPEDATVGIHTVPDLGGGMRLGPHDFWTEEAEYSVDPALRDLFFESCLPFLPALEADALQPDTAGIQSKRYGPGEKSRDFVIRHEADRGLDGLVNLIGIESPGLTSSPAIGEFVADMVGEIL